MRVVSFEVYAVERGAGSAEIGDAGLHKRGRRQSDRQWQRLVKAEDARTARLLARREELRREFDEAVRRGELREPSTLERLQRTAAGHPDNESVQAARRALAKRALRALAVDPSCP